MASDRRGIQWRGDSTPERDVYDLREWYGGRFVALGSPTTLYFKMQDGTSIVVPDGWWIREDEGEPYVSSMAPVAHPAPPEARTASAGPARTYYPWNMPQADDCGACGCRRSGHTPNGCAGAGATCRCPGYFPRGLDATERLIAEANVYNAQMQLVKPAAPPPPPPPGEDAARESAGGYSARHLSAALEWIERNHPGGIALVARALSETPASPPARGAMDTRPPSPAADPREALGWALGQIRDAVRDSGPLTLQRRALEREIDRIAAAALDAPAPRGETASPDNDATKEPR